MNSIAAAKRRRAGVQVAASPMFKSGAPAPTANNPPVRIQHSSSTPSISTDTTTIDTKKPMPLQQVISVLDNRILYLENHLVKSTDEPQLVNTGRSNNHESSNSINKDEIENIIVDTIKNHMSEFNDRYELLASEIVNIKQIVLQLQSYTLDVNKMLLGDRDHLLELVNKANQEPISANIAQELAEESPIVAEESPIVAEESQVVEEESQVVEESRYDDESPNIQTELTEDSHDEDNIEKKKGKRKGKNKNVVQVTLDETQ